MDEKGQKHHIGFLEAYCKGNGLYFDNEGSTDEVQNINIGISKEPSRSFRINQIYMHIDKARKAIQDEIDLMRTDDSGDDLDLFTEGNIFGRLETSNEILRQLVACIGAVKA